jgi:hypothetical protein
MSPAFAFSLLALTLAVVVGSGEAPVSAPTRQADGLQDGTRLLRRAQDAMGGVERLTAVKDTTHTMEITLEPGAGGYRLTQTSRYITPNHFRQDQETPFGRIVVYSDGETGWMSTPQGTAPVSADVVATVRGVLFRQPTALMLSDRDPSRSVRMTGEYAVSIVATSGQEIAIEFSPDSGLPLRQSYVIVAADGRRIERTETFADWRDVDGVKFPFKAVQFENGVKMLEVDVSEYHVDSGLRPIELNDRP